MGTHLHREKGQKFSVRLGILSISSTRNLSGDKSGAWIESYARRYRFDVLFRQVLPDDIEIIQSGLKEFLVSHHPDAVIMTGGTGIAPKDVTIEAVRPFVVRELSSFGPIFSMLSYERIDSAAILSRAFAGVMNDNRVVFCIPGSLDACKLAVKELIFPELKHLLMHLEE